MFFQRSKNLVSSIFGVGLGDKQKKETSVYADLLVRWARLELAQDYSHYPLKVACLPFHHHRVFELGLQRYDKNLYFQTFLRKFSIFFHFGGRKDPSLSLRMTK